MAMPIFVIRTHCSSEKSGPRSARLRLRVRRVEERLEVHRGWQRRPGAVEHRRGGGRIALWCLGWSRRKPNVPDANSNGVRDSQEKLVKDQELLRSPILLLQMLELARGDDEADISAMSKLQDRRTFREGCVGEHVKCIAPQHNH